MKEPKFSRVYVSYEQGKEPEELVGAMSQEIVTLLTGLEEQTITELGGFAFRNPVTGEELFKRGAKIQLSIRKYTNSNYS